MQTLEKVFKAAADKNRIRILKLLQQKKMCVCELAYILGIKQPSVSRHLAKLRQAGLISSERDGFWTNYSLEPKGNAYAVHLVRLLKSWLKNDTQTKADAAQALKADRAKLCCKSKQDLS